MTNSLGIFKQLQPFSIGFDDVFTHFDSFFDSDMRMINSSNYPPYNIVKTGKNNYDIEVALAGFNKKDINVTVEGGKLTIESVKMKDVSDDNVKSDDDSILHKGISKRSFKRVWTISEDVEVKAAELKDGLLKVSMEKIVPEKDKLRKISIK